MHSFLAFCAVGGAILADALTLGGVANGGYFRHGRRTYTQLVLDDLLPRPIL